MLDCHWRLNDMCSRWWNKDIENLVGSDINNLTSSAGHQQVIDGTTPMSLLIYLHV